MKQRPAERPRLLVEELERRILYSADAAALLGLSGAVQGAEVRLLEPVTPARAVADTAAPVQQATAREIVFIDSRVPDAMKLADELMQQRSGERMFDIVMLDANEDGIAQINRVLANENGLAAIHIISHGADGALEIGSTHLDALRLAVDAESVARWGQSLSVEGDLLLYGCDVAQDAAGQAFVQSLARLTGADVAASTDLTGQSQLGGNWNLEYTTGRIEASVAIGAQTQQDWANVLAITVGNTSSSQTTGANSLTLAQTIGSGTNGILVVTVSFQAGSSNAVTSVTYGGTALTFLGSAENASGAHTRTEMWYLKSPAAGTANVVISMNASIAFTGGATNFFGVDQTTPTGTFVGATANNRTPSVTVTSAAGELVIDSLAERATSSGTVGASQAEAYHQLTGTAGGDTWGSSSTNAGAASVTMSWSTVGSGTGEWAMGAVSLKPFLNTAPTLDAAKSPALAAINEDAGAPSGAVGTLVSSLVDFAAPSGQVDNVTDPDAGALLGIAVTAADTTNGSWWYSTNNGSSWNALGAVADNNARLLAADANTRIYFQPNANYNGTLANAITFRAWDRTTGTAGGTADTTNVTNTTLDLFSVASYGNNDGTASWSGPWVETDGKGGGATAGDVMITGGTLQLKATKTNDLINRLVNLAGATTATLSFNYDNQLTGSDTIVAQVSNDGGATYTTLATFSAGSNFGTGSKSIDISSYIASNSQVQFAITSGGGKSFFFVDNVQVSYGNSGNGGASACSAATDTASLVINAVNDSPVLDNTKSPTLSAINEDAGSPAGAVGTLVSSLVDLASPAGQLDNVTDVDASPLLGIAVTSADTTSGSWWYSTDGGTNWNALSIVTNGSARLLAADANTRLYFQPNANWNGTLASAITFRAWDRSNGSNGALIDTSVNGGTSAFSAATDTASLVVNAVNDAPVLDNTGAMVLTNAQQDNTNPAGTTVAALIASAGGNRITDVDAGAVEGIAITARDNSNGTWQYSIDGGVSWVAMGNVNGSQALVLSDTANDMVRFVPGAGFSGNATISFRAWDRSDGLVSGTSGVNTNTNGGITPFSSATQTASVYVEPLQVLLWMSTSGDVSGSGLPGLSNWTQSTVLTLGDPGLSLGAGTTGGRMTTVTNFDGFAVDGDVNINGLHFVNRAVTLNGAGIVAGPLNLLKGDMLFVTAANESLSTAAGSPPAGWANNISTTAGDVYVFRPVTAGDYSSGYFRKVMAEPGPNPTRDIALVETATTVGGTVLTAGDILFTQSGGIQQNNIYWYKTATNTTSLLIDGSQIGIPGGGAGAGIDSLDLVQSSFTSGGFTFQAGDVLAGFNTQVDAVGSGGSTVTAYAQDLVRLRFTATTFGAGTAVASAMTVLDGANIKLDTANENLDAVGMLIQGGGANVAPVVTVPGAALAYTEGAGPVIVDATATVSDVDSPDLSTGVLRVDLTVNGTPNDRLAIRNQGTGSGQIGVSGSNVTYNFGAGAVTIGTLAGGTDGSTPLLVTLNASATPAAVQALLRNVTYENVSNNPSPAPRTLRVLLSDGDGATSSAAGKTINVTNVNDPPVAVNDAYSVNEDSTLVVAPSTANLANLWGFNEGGSTQTTSSTGSLASSATRGSTAGVDAADPTWTTGYVGGSALAFNGAGQYVDTTSTDLKTASNFALSAWFQTNTTTGAQHLVWQGYPGGNGYGNGGSTTAATSEMSLSIGSYIPAYDNKIVFFLGYDVPANGADCIFIASASNFTDTGNWHNVAVTVTDLGGGVMQASLYVDGKLEGTDSGSQNDRSVWGALRIGAPGDGTRSFNGKIDDVRVYSTALAAGSVQGIATAGVLGNDSDTDSATLKVNTGVVTGPANGTLSINADGSFAYTPNANFYGTDSFTYRANDGVVNSNVATVTITVNPVVDTPSVTSATTNEDTQSTTGLAISRNAADGAEVTHFQITGITNGTLYQNDGTTAIANGAFISVAQGSAGLKFTPAANFSGNGSFTVQASTTNAVGGLGGGTVNATITVNSVNDAPVIISNGGGASAAASVAENTTAVTTVTSIDVDGGAPVYSILAGGDAAKFTINSTTGALSFIAAPDFENPADIGANNVYDLTVQVSDGAGGVDTQAISVTVTDVSSALVVSTAADNNDSGIVSGNAAYNAEWLNANKGADNAISLREAILAANNTSGSDTIAFAIASGGAVKTITLASALPSITDAVTIDGTTQTTYIGDTNPGQMGTGGAVGVDGLALSLVNRPEIEIVGTNSIQTGLNVLASNSTIRGIAIYGFGDGAYQTSKANILIGNGVSGTLIEGNVIGSGAAAFADPGAGIRTGAANILFDRSGSATINNNLIGFSGSQNIWGYSTATGLTITNNEIRGNGLGVFPWLAGVDIEGGANHLISGNLISGHIGPGVNLGATSATDIVRNNTISLNGAGNNDTAGVRIFSGNGGLVSKNQITTNVGAGVLVGSAASGVTISQNSIFGNGPVSGQIGIDLLTAGNNQSSGDAPFVTPNDAGDSDAGGNGLQNFPVLSSARVLSGTQVTVAGTFNSTANSFFRIEFFSSTAQDGSSYGEGQTYLGSVNVTTDGSGYASFNTMLTASVAAGSYVSTTATKSNATFTAFTDTSEFARNVVAVSQGIVVTPVSVTPLGSETQVNTNTSDAQTINPNVAQAVASDAAGNFVVVWASNLQDGSSYGVYAQRFAADGTPQGSEFLVNTTTVDNQLNAAVAMDAAGNFVVTWSSNLQDGSGYGIYAQRFNATGVAQGSEFLVNTTTAGSQTTPAIAMSPTGGFVIAWTGGGQDPDASSGIYAQRFNAGGVVQGSEFRVNTYTSNTQQLTSAAMDGAGNFVVVWASLNQDDGASYGVYGQRFDATGAAQGAEFRVNTTIVNSQLYNDVAMLEDGRFVVAYQSRNADGSFEVFLKRYAADGSTLGGETRVNASTVSSAQQPILSVAADSSGNITVVWNSAADGSGIGVVGRRLDWSGTPLGGEFQVNTTTAGNQLYAEVVVQPGGGFIVAWAGNGVGDADGVFQQRYGLTTTEAGGSATFQVVLEAAPTADVVIAVSVPDGTEGSVSVASLTFTTANWNIAQTVTVTGVQDYTNDGNVAYTVALGAATSTDPNFNGLNPADLSVINLEMPNAAPVNTVPGAQTVNEDTALVFSSANGNAIAIGDADADSNAMQVTLSVTNGVLTLGGVSGLSFSTGANGSATMTFTGTIANINTALNGLRFDPTGNFNGSALLTLNTNDQGNSGTGGAKSDNDSVAITVNAVNDAPTRTAGSVANLAVLEDSGLTSLGLGGVAYGPGGDAYEIAQTLSYAVTALPSGGIGNVYLADGTTQVALGSYTLAQIQGMQFKTTANGSGVTGFQYNVTDSGGTANGGLNSISEFVLITVTAVNDAPTLSTTAVNPAFTEAAGLDAQAAAVNVFSGAAATTVETGQTITGLTFTVSGLLNGANEVIVVDGRTITLGANSSGTTVTNSLAYSSTISGGTATIVLSGGSLNAAATQTLVNGITYQNINTDNPTAGSRVFTLTQVRDSGGVVNGGVDTTTLSIASTVTVSAVNDAPIAAITPATYAATEQVALTLKNTGLAISDVDAAAGSMTVTLSVTEGTLTVTAGGSGALVSNSGTSSVTITGTVTQINNLLSTDGTSTVSYTDGTDTPSPSATLTLQVNDNGNTGGGSLTNSDTATINITAVNDPPVLAAIGNKSVNEGATLAFTASATDPDLPAQSLTYSLDAASMALGMTINASTGAFSWTPSEAQGGLTPSVTITVTDNGTGNLTDSETFTITVGDTNLAPVLAAIGNRSVNEGATLSFTASATDADLPSQSVTYSLDAASLALGMSINASTGAFSWSPNGAQGGTTPSVTITVTDNGTGNLTDSETFTISVGEVNTAPVLAAIGNQAVNEGATLSFTTSATDADLPSQTLAYSLDAASIALGMSINSSTGVFSWTPSEAQGGLAPSVTITVTDNGTGNLTDSETFTITVADINSAPVLAAIGNRSVNEGATLSFTASATDADLPSQTLAYSLDAASIALGMSINSSTGVFSWTPTEAQGGLTPSVTITVTDNGTGNLLDSETFTITVGDLNSAPVLAAIGNQSVNEGATLAFAASATDADLPAQSLTYSLDAASLALGMTINSSTGVFSWTPTEAQGGLAPSVTVTVTDNGTGNLLDSETFTITVADINSAPVLAAIGNQSVNEGATLSFTASATDADLPSQTLSYTLDAASIALGMSINSSTGVFSWTPTEAQGGLAPSVTITVTDNGTGNLLDSETFTITVGDTNLAPVLAAIGNQTVNEGATLSFTASATDADLPSQTLTYTLDAASLALGMTINASTGTFSWTPSEAQGGLTPSVTITVTDNGTGNLLDSEAFTITVGDLNSAPVLAAIGNQSVNEGATLSFTASASDADVPAQSLSYSLDAASIALGMSINSSTGVFSWTPSEAQGGLAPSVTITVTDNGTGNLTDSETFTITVADINSAPVLAAIGNRSVNEGATLSFTASATDADLPSQTLAYSLDAASIALGMSINSSTGVFSWTPSEAQGGLAPSVTITVTDNGTGNLLDSETFTITVGDTNLAPVLAAIGNQTVNEGATLSFTASATDADLPSQSLTYSLDAASLALGMSINASSGAFSWTPSEAQGGLTPSVTVTVTDNGTGNLADSETFTITVGDTNLAPVLAAIGNQTVNEGATLSFTASATDADLPSQTLAYSLDAASIALGMSINSSTGLFSWTPTEAQGGLAPSVTVTVTDNGTGNLLDSETFTITVGDLNSAPVLAAIGNQSVNEGATLSLTASATDADLPSQTLTYSLDAAAIALGMTINASTGAFSWTPSEAQGGLAPSVTVTVTDNGTGNLLDSETFTITVGDLNSAPVLAAIGNQSVNEGATLSFTASATDADLPAQTLTYSLDAASIALGMSINSSTGVFSWTPTEAQGGLAPSVTVTVTDNGTGNLLDSETFTITVGDTNLAPVLSAIGNQSINEGASLSFTASATDADLPAQTLTYSLDAASIALGMSINSSTGVFSWTPTEAQGGLAPSVTITVTDNGTGNLLDSETFTITVGDTNQAPVLAAIGNQSVNEGATLSFTASATDADLPAQSLSYSLDAASIALGMSINASTGAFSWTPTEAQGGSAPSVTITVTDNGTGNLTDSETFTITVADLNSAPVLAAIGNQSVNEGATLSFTASATDADLPAQSLSYSLDASSIALGMSINASTGAFSWTPTEAQGGSAPSVTITVTDNGTGNLTDSETFTITVADLNSAPVLVAIGNQSVNEGATLSFTASATDADLPAQSLSYSLDAASIALGMSINSSTGVFSWTPTEAQGGLAPSVTVTVTDNGTGNLTDSETFTIMVADLNSAPVLVAIGNQSVNEGATLSFTASATDADLPAQSLSYSLDAASIALGMSINSSTGVFSWTPTEAQGGQTPSVTITVTDNGTGNLLDSETFTITVADLNSAPVLAAIGNQSVNEGAALSFTASATDADLPSQTLAYSLDAASIALGMSINSSTGVFSWTPTEAQGGLTPSVTITVTDNGTGNLLDSETFTISVAAVNDAPMTSQVTLAPIAEDSGARVIDQAALLVNAADVDGPSLTATNLAIARGTGTLVDNGDGTWTYTPASNDDTSVSFSYTVTDGSLTAVGSATLDITPVNDAPVLVTASLTLQAGQTQVLGTAQLSADDVDSATSTLIFEVRNLSAGQFEYVANAGVPISQFTQAQVVQGEVRFVQTNMAQIPGFDVTAFDGNARSAIVSVVASVTASATAAAPPASAIAPPTGATQEARPDAEVAPAAPAADARDTGQRRTPSGERAPATTDDNAAALGLDGTPNTYLPASTTPVRTVVSARDTHTPQPLLAKSFFDLDLGLSADAYLLRVAHSPMIDLLQSAAPDLRAGPPAGPDQGGTDADVRDEGAATVTVQVAQATGVALSAGAVWWALRAGGLLASLLGTLPTWRHVDLLAVLPDEEDDDDWDAAGDDEARRDEQAVGDVLEPALDGDRAMSTQVGIRIGPITRVSLGLMALLISLVLVADFVLGVVPNRGQAERHTRQRVAENLAIQITGLLESGEETMVGKTIQQVLSRDPDIRAISVRRNDGSTVLKRGDVDKTGAAAVGTASTANQLRVPILSGPQLWGEIEVRFAANDPATLKAWMAQPSVQMLAVLAIGGFALCYAYLRRAMQYLDPSASVPDRVRKGFDTLTEGIVILDQQARIVLANQAFRRLHPQASGELNGQRIDTLAWLSAGRQGSPDEPAPWAKTLQSSVTVDAEPLTLPQPEGPASQLLVTSAPIADAKGRARGCMITFDDVTAVHRANDELRSTLAELQDSRQQIEQQNRELSRLATRDSLTGCFNRRAFFEMAQNAFDAASRGNAAVCCIMADIDHFKQFNDLYGHAVGDQVIRAVARGLSAGLRQQDIMCRYGGEEFCIVLPGATPEEAMAAAERLRIDIETHAREAIRGTDVMTITASFGVSTRAMGSRSLEELIEQADLALYKSKQTGRNRATAFERVAA